VKAKSDLAENSISGSYKAALSDAGAERFSCNTSHLIRLHCSLLNNSCKCAHIRIPNPSMAIEPTLIKHVDLVRTGSEDATDTIEIPTPGTKIKFMPRR
jgi:hypothetical protein